MGEPDKMYVTADCVTFCYEPETGLEVLLVQRGNEPFKGQWALPGGFVELDEDLPDAAVRELKEETGVEPDFLIPTGVYGKPGRDPRGRNVTAAHLAAVGHGRCAVCGGDDAADAKWVPLDSLPELAFDHREILDDACVALDRAFTNTYLAFLLVPKEFLLAQVEDMVNQVSLDLWEEADLYNLILVCGAEIVAPGVTPEESTFRVSVEDYGARLPAGEEVLDMLDSLAQSFGFDSIEEIAEMSEEDLRELGIDPDEF